MKGNRAFGIGLALVWMTVVGCGQPGLSPPLATSQLAEPPLLSANDALATPSIPGATPTSIRSNASLATAYAAMLTPIPSSPVLTAPSVQQPPDESATADSSETPVLVPVQTSSASEQEPLSTPTPTATDKPGATPRPTNTPTPAIKSTPTITATPPATLPTPTATYTPDAEPTQTADAACLPMAEPTLWLEVEGSDTSITVGEEVSIRLCASGLVTGLAGFILTVSAQNGNVVEFTAVEFPFGLYLSSSIPDSTLKIQAADLADLVPRDTESALLATLKILAKSSGSTLLLIPEYALDDEDGLPVTLKTLQIILDVAAN